MSRFMASHMNMIRGFFLFFLFCQAFSFAQVGTGQWRLHVPSRKAIDVVAGDGRIFTAFQSGVLEYFPDDEEKRLWTSVNGLSDISPSCLNFDNQRNALYIGYENGNFDKLENNRVTNIPAIKLAQIQGSKKIYKIVQHQNFLYLATGFGVVKVDPSKNEVKDTYYPTAGNEAILDISIKGDSIFALSETRMYKGKLSNFALADASQWTVDPRLPVQLVNNYDEIELVGDELFVLQKVPGYGADSVFRLSNTGLELFTQEPFTLEINSLNTQDGLLAINMEGGALVYNEDGSYATIANAYSFGGFPSVNSSVLYNGLLWMADNSFGLVRFFSEYSAIPIAIDGPAKNEFYSMDWQKGRLVVAGGGISSISPTFSSSGIYLFEDEKWTVRDRDNMNMWTGQPVWDFLAVSINPNDPDQIAVGTFSEIPVSIMGSDGQVADTFTPLNSTLTTTAVGGNWTLVSDLSYDDNDNLWVVNAYSDKPLNVLSADGTWYGFDCGTAAKNKFSRKLVIDYNGNKWFSLDGAGVFGFKEGESLADPSDDDYVQLNTGDLTGALPSNTVTALAVDFDNEIWIGTDNGFAVLYSSDAAFTAAPGQYNAQRIKLEFEGNVEYVLGNTAITDIEVDGGNRKWMGTANAGIILLSPDGLQIIEQHTTENSPLISNNILDLKLDHQTGELFIITDMGLVSYRTDATYEDPEYADVKIFPNPARPEFEGPITIQGIRYNSDVKITDVAGNLVYMTTSNGGTATWDGKNVNGERVKTGVYLIWTAANEGKGRKVGKVLVVN